MSKFDPTHIDVTQEAFAPEVLIGARWTPRTRRRCLVALTLIVADLGAGLATAGITASLGGVSVRELLQFVPASVLAYWWLGLYGGLGPCPCERLRLRAHGVMLLAIADYLIQMLAGPRPSAGLLALTCSLLLVIGYYTESYARGILIRRELWGGPAAFVGAGAASQQLARFLQQHSEFGISPAGFVRGAQDGVGNGWPCLPVLGEVADLGRLASRIEVLVFGSADDAAGLNPAVRRALNARELVVVGEAHEVQSLWLSTRTLGGLIGIELRRVSDNTRKAAIKRLIDLALAVPACVVAFLLVSLAALAIRLSDGGPAFYVQDRVGEGGRIVRVRKLRTMYKDAEQRLKDHLAADPAALAEWRRFYKLKNDPRILPGVGSFLRRTSLDELPQLWNVVCGHMSLVGPRPFPAYHVDSFDPEFRTIRSSVPPGLSGLWQVAARSDGDLAVQRAQDLFYIQNWSVWLDLYVLMETPLAVLGTRGAR